MLANKTLVCQHLNDTDLSMNQIVKFVLAKKTLDCQHLNDTNLSMNWIVKRIEKATFNGATNPPKPRNSPLPSPLAFFFPFSFLFLPFFGLGWGQCMTLGALELCNC